MKAAVGSQECEYQDNALALGSNKLAHWLVSFHLLHLSIALSLIKRLWLTKDFCYVADYTVQALLKYNT